MTESDTRAASAGATADVAELRGITKSFGGVTVLHDVSLAIRAGEIHALVGQNGSGKSTLIKVLSGYHLADDGVVVVGGTPLTTPFGRRELEAHGVSFLHQDLGLVDDLSVLDNMTMERWSVGRSRTIRWSRERRQVDRALREFGITADSSTLVAGLSQADKAIVGLARAFLDVENRSGGLLVLDEPTAYLPRKDVGRLFRAVAQFVGRGFGVLFVTHRLDEVAEYSDRLSVLRDGRLVASADTASVTHDDMVRMILGRSITQMYPAKNTALGVEVLRVSAFGCQDRSPGNFRDLSVTLRAGEVVGMTGLVGMGQDSVPYALFGARATTGTVEIVDRGGRWRRVRTAADLIHHGAALVPANRLRDGGVAAMTVQENLALPVLSSFFARGLLRRGQETRSGHELVERFDVRPPDPAAPLGSLSGGNQQKVMLAKWLQTRPAVLVLHEPTQGVDVGSRSQIFSFLQAAAAAGTAVLVVSAEYEDLAHLCGRVMVFADGLVRTELTGADVTPDQIVQACLQVGSDALDTAVPA